MTLLLAHGLIQSDSALTNVDDQDLSHPFSLYNNKNRSAAQIKILFEIL